NLAVVVEKAGRPHDAERSYRRAVEIATASLPADDPMVAASRQNLEDFCHAHGLPIEKPAVIEPARFDAPALPRPTAAPPLTAVSRKASRAPATIAISIVILVIAAFLIARSRSPRQESTTTVPAAVPTPAPTPETDSPPPAADRPPAPGAITLATVQLC